MDLLQRRNRRPLGHGVYEHMRCRNHQARLQPPEGFASRQLNEQIIENATILVAEKVHADWIVRESGPSTTPRSSCSSEPHVSVASAFLPLLPTVPARSISTGWKTPTVAAPQQQRLQWMKWNRVTCDSAWLAQAHR